MRRIRPLPDTALVIANPGTKTHRLEGQTMPRPFVAGLFATWPSAGFHWRLVTLTLDRSRSHPLTPLPMVRL